MDSHAATTAAPRCHPPSPIPMDGTYHGQLATIWACDSRPPGTQTNQRALALRSMHAVSLPVDSGSGARIQHRARRTDVRTRGEDAGRARTGTAAEPRAGGPGARATHVCPRPRFAPRSPSSPARPGRCVCVTACAGPDRCCQVHAPRESDVVVQFVLYPCLLVGHWCMPSQVRGQEGFCADRLQVWNTGP